MGEKLEILGVKKDFWGEIEGKKNCGWEIEILEGKSEINWILGGNWKKIGLLREIGIFAGEIKENLDFEEKNLEEFGILERKCEKKLIFVGKMKEKKFGL